MKYKKNLFWFLFSFSLFAILIFFLPSFLSTEAGKKIVFKVTEKKEIKEFSAEELSFSWLGPQKFKKIYLSTDEINFKADFIEIDINFFTLLKLNQNNFLSLKTHTEIKEAALEINQPNLLTAQLSEINGSIKIAGKDQHLNLNLSGKSLLNNKSSGFFKLNVETDLNNTIGELFFKNFPTVVIDEFFLKNYKGVLTQILGPSSTIMTTFKIIKGKGPINLELSSTNAHALIYADYSKKYLRLNKPLTATIYLTEKLSQYLLKDLNPLLITGISSQNPILIRISPEKFLWPLDPFELKGLKIENAIIDLGKIRVKNGDNINLIIGLMKYNALYSVEEMNVWCSPVNIRLNNGILYTSRMDALLADSLHICTWGLIDLISDRVTMTLGLTAQALERSFGIKNLPSNYVMQIPLKGKTSKIKIDTKTAAAKIAALLALQTVKKKTPFGQFLDIFNPVEEDQSTVPSSLYPLPWKN